jgi:hypothetical protein
VIGTGFDQSGSTQGGGQISWIPDCSNLSSHSFTACTSSATRYNIEVSATDLICPIPGRASRIVAIDILSLPQLVAPQLLTISATANDTTVRLNFSQFVDTITIDPVDSFYLQSITDSNYKRRKSAERRKRSFVSYRMYRASVPAGQPLIRTGPTATIFSPVGEGYVLDSVSITDTDPTLDFINYDYYYYLVNTSTCDSIESSPSDTLKADVIFPNIINGTINYAHTLPTPLIGVPVHLKSYLGYTAASDTTDSTGTYHLSGFPNGNYYLDADINYEVNSINSSDALLAQRFVVMLEMLSNLQQKSADVTGDQRIRTSDALMITRYTASLINQFPVGRFVNTRPDVTASGSVQSVNMLALASGDVNGNLLVQSSPPTLVLDTVYSSGTQGTATVRFTTSGSGIYERGVCWGTSPNPTTDSSKSVAGSGGFGFTHSFGGLTTGVQYHVRAYAMNSVGTYYSNEQMFVLQTFPSVATAAIRASHRQVRPQGVQSRAMVVQQ